MFNIGDKVKCIDAGDIVELIEGSIYVVHPATWPDGQHTAIDNSGFGYLNERFVLADHQTCPVITNNQPTANTLQDHHSAINLGYPPKIPGISEISYQMAQKKCECGCQSVGSNKHSDYCPLYTH